MPTLLNSPRRYPSLVSDLSRPLAVAPYVEGMNVLLAHIQARLTQRKICVVFENELDRVWPQKKPKPDRREDAIRAFAKANGLIAIIHRPGIRVTFKRAPVALVVTDTLIS
jgi:hypothetical protein